MTTFADKEKRTRREAFINSPESQKQSEIENHEQNPILRLQHKVGNQAVQRLLQARQSALTEPLTPVEGETQSQIESQKGGGEPLPAALQAEMEETVGGDLSGVRLHSDLKSASLANSLGARAFTQGRDVFFDEKSLDPASDEGRETLAHELTHVADGRAATGSVQRAPKKEPEEIEMPVEGYYGHLDPYYINPTYAGAQEKIHEYFDYQRGLAQLLIRIRDYGFREFQIFSDAEYNKKEEGFLTQLFEFALNFIPAAGALLKCFKVLQMGKMLGKLSGVAKTAEKAGEVAKGAEKVEESASVVEKVLSVNEAVKGTKEAVEKGEKLTGPAPNPMVQSSEGGESDSEAKAKGDFSAEVLHTLAELDSQKWTGAWADEIKLHQLMNEMRKSEPTIDLEANVTAILETLYGEMQIPDDGVVMRVGEVFELQLYQSFWVEERGAHHLYLGKKGSPFYSDEGIQVMPEGVVKRIEALHGWDLVKIPDLNQTYTEHYHTGGMIFNPYAQMDAW